MTPPVFFSLAFGLSVGTIAWRLARRLPVSPREAEERWEAFLARWPIWRSRWRGTLGRRIEQADVSSLTPGRLAAVAAALAAAGASVGAAGLGPSGAAVAGAAAAALPFLWLSARAERRLARLEEDFPFAVDLLALAVAGGLHVEWALRRILPRLPAGPLREELGRLLAERTVGQGWADVLRRLAERAGSASVRHVTASLVQAETTGMSLAPLLARLSEDLRARQLERAETRIQKAPVRMLFPLVFCILPVVFVVLLGPILHRLWA